MMGQNHDMYLNLDQIISWLVDSDLKDYGIVSDISLIQERVLSTQDYYLEDAARAMIKNCRGKICSFPHTFNAIHFANNMLRKGIVEKEDQIIKMGTKKSGKKGSSSPKMLEYKEEKDKNIGLEDFF
jgi:hypothetical protein